VELKDGREIGVARYSLQSDRDTIFKGHTLLKTLLSSNFVLAASVMVRKSCYEKLGAFPLDMPYAGDWYLWMLFALHYDAAFFAEPMVAYRLHDHCITDEFINKNVRICANDDLAVIWRIMRQAHQAGYKAIAEKCMRAIAYEYARQLVGKRYRFYQLQMSQQEFEESLSRFAENQRQADLLRAWIHASVGDLNYQQGNLTAALESYQRGHKEYHWMPRVWLKTILLRTGGAGAVIRRGAGALRDMSAIAKSDQ
jgi:hypothetical protein